MINKVLILEGGGMRCAYTCGILSAFLDKGIHFDQVIATSSGSICALYYLSKQRKCLQRVFEQISEAKLFGLKSWLDGQGLFNLRGLFNQLHFFDDFDYEVFKENPTNLFLGTTRVMDATSVFWSKNHLLDENLLENIVVASASLPIIAPQTNIQGQLYVDGGVLSSIPWKFASSFGQTKMVIIHTQPEGYQKKKQFLDIFSHLYLSRYPALRQAIYLRHLRYNKSLIEIKRLCMNREAFIFQPTQHMITRYSQKRSSIQDAYQMGLRQGNVKIKQLNEFLRGN